MPQKRKAEAGAVNIRLHPHPDYHYYIKLFRSAFGLQKSLKSRGDQMLLLSYLERPKEKDGQVEVHGTLARFTDIDQEQPWFNMQTNDEAEEHDVMKINIPAHLKPNYKPFSFIFFPQKHLFVFERYSEGSTISHGIVASFFKRLFEEPEIVETYGSINIDVVCDHKGLDSILRIHQLKRLEITVKRPNPDDWADAERRVLEKLDAQNANKIEQKMTCITGQSIKPDNDTKVLAKVALSNGKVKGDGVDENGETVEYSTIDYPKTERMMYDPETMTASIAFNQIAHKILH